MHPGSFKVETNLPTLCITNVEDSTIWDACDYHVACYAGVEQGIAATKSFTAQMLCLILISLKLIENTSGDIVTKSLKESLFQLPQIIEKALETRKELTTFAKFLSKQKTLEYWFVFC